MENNSWCRNVIILSIMVLFIVSMIGCTIDKDISVPLVEHPRSDFIRNTWINQNGQWDFALDPDEIGELKGWYNDTFVFDRKITVPFSWAAPLSGIVERDIHIGWYARELEIPKGEEWSNKQIFIVIGASDFGIKLWLSGYTPFEIVLEQSGKLLRKQLSAYFASKRQADRLTFKNLFRHFRHAAKHGLIDPDTCERWLEYRDNRSDTAHDYGEGFAETTLKLLPDFIADAKALAGVIEEADDD